MSRDLYLGTVNNPEQRLQNRIADLEKRIRDLERFSNLRVDGGSGVTTSWSGSSARSNTGTVLHDLGATPHIVIPMAQNNTGLSSDPVIITFNYTPTQFQFRANTLDGSLPAAGVTTPTWSWIAILL